MAIQKSTLVNIGEDGIEYIFPRTSSDIVDYDDEISVKDKIDNILSDIEELKREKISSTSLYDTKKIYLNVYSSDDKRFEKVNLYVDIVDEYEKTDNILQVVNE